ncbi:MAG: hypothetical protein A3F12_00780 [Gammaproteobacteria bacterium RIFCSPHIGHO2_12_FULL_38_14]|nr:MAG: hypothetical protein A3F12_00780 [Gammaproteobacteria bacterium RIFCSPHIGHO2_12_FULL_38_14]
MPSLQTLLLAAGKGLRISRYAKGLPKPLLSIAGDPIILRNLRWLNSFAHVQSVWINLHYQAALMEKKIKNFSRQLPNLTINFIYEKKILGTAGALINIAPILSRDDLLLVVYSDNLFNFDLDEFVSFHYKKKNLATIALFDDRKNIHTGIAGGRVSLDNQLRITGFFEKSPNAGLHHINAGAYLFTPEILSHITPQKFCDFGRDIFPKMLLENAPLNGYIINGYCLGLDTEECFNNANDIITQGKITLL